MRKRYVFGIVLTVLLAVLLIILSVIGSWYFTPKRFLKGVEADEVDRIEIFDGGTGRRFFVDRDSDICAIVESIQGIEMKRGKISSNYDGFAFSMKFLDKEGGVIDSFIINSLNVIRDDPFFYLTSEGVLPYEHLAELEKQYFAEDGQ